ncbi:MAG: hypothetical protein JWP87_1787 [Labilithrix sp.]|nr:hypothetical protein [Labilithrix sp.]
MPRQVAVLLVVSLFASVSAGCAVASDAGDEASSTDSLDLEEEVGRTEDALSGTRSVVKANVDLGGGVIVANRPGGFYMGRLLPGQSFDRQGSWYLSKENGTNYAWGMAWGNSDACLWIGPSRGKRGFTAGKWATPGTASPTARCTDTMKKWLSAGDAANVGSRFNCPPPTSSAHGTEKKLLEDAPFYWNVAWTEGEMGYDGGELRDFAKTIPAGTSVWYRYTTRDGKRVVAFIPTVGWGFFPAGVLDTSQTGTWSFPESAGTPHKC